MASEGIVTVSYLLDCQGTCTLSIVVPGLSTRRFYKFQSSTIASTFDNATLPLPSSTKSVQLIFHRSDPHLQVSPLP